MSSARGVQRREVLIRPIFTSLIGCHLPYLSMGGSLGFLSDVQTLNSVIFTGTEPAFILFLNFFMHMGILPQCKPMHVLTEARRGHPIPWN